VTEERRRAVVLLLVMFAVAAAATGVSIAILYDAARDGQRDRLVEIVKSRARLVEAVARYDTAHGTDHPGGPAAATLSQLREAHERFAGFGETGEFVLARREGGRIRFLLRHRQGGLAPQPDVPLASERAEPMERALRGESGTVVGLDYRGKTVLAAYEPVAVLDLGMVAKIDLAEVRAPFVRAGLIALAGMVALVVLGSMVAMRIGGPLLRRLEESERKYRALFTGSAEAFWVFTDRFLDCNEAACRLFGASREEILGRTPTDFSPELQPDGRRSEEVARELLAAARAGEEQRFTWRHLRPDGHEVDTEISLSSVRLGRKTVLIATGRDVTARLRMERELDRSRRLMEAVIEDTDGIVFVKDTGCRYLLANSAVARATGLERDDLLGRSDDDLFPEEMARRLAESDRRILESGGTESIEVTGSRRRRPGATTKAACSGSWASARTSPS